MSDDSSHDRDPVSTAHHPSSLTHHLSAQLSSLAPLIFSCAALILTLVGLFEWDVPLARFVRSLYPLVVSTPNPWLVLFSDLGDRLGKGDALVLLSLVLLAVGYGFTDQQWKDAGRQSLIAHGLVAVAAMMLKHAIGRPRPKFIDTSNFEFSPASGSGWDSFPSGHASASFAVVTVLAAKFPRARWPLFSVAVAIAASRVLRGSHYPTDVAGGAALGCVMGMIAVHPWREWRTAARTAVCRVAPFFVVMLALVWTIVQLPSETWLAQLLLWGGWLLTLAGLVGHVVWRVRSSWGQAWLSGSLARALVGLGLGMTTGSLFVTTVVLFVCAAHWLEGPHGQGLSMADAPLGVRAIVAEGLFVMAVLLVLVASYLLKGIVPM